MQNHRFPVLALCGLAAALAACPALAQPASPAPVPTPPPPAVPGDAPKIQFATTLHDFGKVSAGEVVHANFYFTNTGNQMLEIREVRPTCGCTTAGTWEHQIPPGRSGVIPLQVNTANFSGQVTKFVGVTCNDPAQSFINLQIHGTIWKPVDVTPPFVVFNLTPESGTNEVRTVKITSNLDQPLELGTPEVNGGAFRAEIKTIQPGKEFDLVVTPGMELKPGTSQASISVKTSATNTPVITITAMAIVQPPVVAMPNQLFLPSGPLPSQVQYTVTVQNNSTNLIGLPDATVNVSNVQLAVREAQTGKLFTVALTFPPGFQLPSSQAGLLTVKTTHPSVPQLTVPIIQPPRATPPPAPAFAPPPPPPPSIARPPEPRSGTPSASVQ